VEYARRQRIKQWQVVLAQSERTVVIPDDYKEQYKRYQAKYGEWATEEDFVNDFLDDWADEQGVEWENTDWDTRDRGWDVE
jgi:hypothetical protein